MEKISKNTQAKKKLLYIHQYFVFPEEAGGTRSYDLSTSFVKKGLEVEIVTSSAYMKDENLKNGWNLIERDGLKIHVLKSDYSNNASTIKRIISFIKFLVYSTLKALKIKCDVVLATSTPLTIGVPALVKRLRHKTPYIFETRDVWPEAVVAIGAINNKLLIKLLYLLEKIIYKGASGIVPLSVDMAKSIVSRYSKICKEKPIEVIENISEIERFQNVSKNSEGIKKLIGFVPRYSILYAGTFGKVNGINYVVDLAYETLKLDPMIVYLLVGKGAQYESLISYAENKGVLNKNLFVLDPVAKKELPDLYNEVDMGSSFVIPIKELWANSANKFFDTLAAGRPILINHEGWQKKLINDENVGYVLPTVINESVAEDFVFYTKDEISQNQQRVKSRNLAERFSLNSAVEKYAELIDLVIK